MVVIECAVSRTEHVFAMKMIYHYEDPPTFAHIGSNSDYRSVDYDAHGNLIVWRTLEKYILSTPERNDNIEKLKSFFVTPDGKVLDKSGNHTKLTRFPIGNPNNMYEFNMYQLATGRGFSTHLATVRSVESLPLGLTKVTARGSYWSSLPGTWELTLDPNSDYLVRKAILTPDGRHIPAIEVTSTGLVAKDLVQIARNGKTTCLNVFEVLIEVRDISKVVGRNVLYDEVLSRLNSPLCSGKAEIMDYRSEKAVRIPVKHATQ
jgi:hypothetical protein